MFVCVCVYVCVCWREGGGELTVKFSCHTVETWGEKKTCPVTCPVNNTSTNESTCGGATPANQLKSGSNLGLCRHHHHQQQLPSSLSYVPNLFHQTSSFVFPMGRFVVCVHAGGYVWGCIRWCAAQHSPLCSI